MKNTQILFKTYKEDVYFDESKNILYNADTDTDILHANQDGDDSSIVKSSDNEDSFVNAFNELNEIQKDIDKLSDVTITLYNLKFEVDKNTIKLNTENLTNIEILDSVKNILQELNSIEWKGFVNTTNLMNFPIIRDFILEFASSKEYLNGDKSSEAYKWIYNIVMLYLYELTLNLLFKSDSDSDLDSDFIIDLKLLTKDILNKIDPSIRVKLEKRGIKLIQNTYTGFDTEYMNIDTKTNKLLSVQLAVNSKTLLTFPKNSNYFISSLDALTGQSYKLMVNNKKFKYSKIENIINDIIYRIRDLKFGNNDRSISILINGLKDIKWLSFIETDNSFTFSFPRSFIQPFIFYNKKEIGYTLSDVVNQSNKLALPQLVEDYDKLIKLLELIFNKNDIRNFKWNSNIDFSTDSSTDSKLAYNPDNTLKHIISTKQPDILDNKKLTRTYFSSFTDDRVSVTKIKNNYIIAHLSQADLSMLNDFKAFKNGLFEVNKKFVTLGKPIEMNGTNIIIIDTTLLTPAKDKSLNSLGSLHGTPKIKLTGEQKENMDLLLKKDKNLFEKYALKDALITLIHANFMENYNFYLKEIGIPVTLSKLGTNYVKNFWKKENYQGYQISNKFLLSDAAATITPKGLLATSNTGLKLNLYIANYKGGRNESFMYGVDLNTIWFDYDIKSAYTTILAAAGNPIYEQGTILNEVQLNELSKQELIFSYTVINAEFSFPPDTKYPSIPCYVDENTTVYPLKGESVLTGAEYLLALKQECKIKIKEIYYIPFQKNNKGVITKQPFNSVIKELQYKRREHPTGSLMNLTLKDIANSIYGTVSRGINEKKKFDIKTGKTLKMDANELSNPIIASWTTAFIRSIIGECLHNISILKGQVVSVTTDGFITDIENLEKLLIDTPNNDLIMEYKKLRNDLTDNTDNITLELKNKDQGILSCKTRGQISKNGKIKALTGFQYSSYNNQDLWNFLVNTMSNKDKYFEYVQKSLRSAKDIYLEGGHVTPLYKDLIFRIHYDNKRIIEDTTQDSHDFSNVLLDTKPVPDINFAKNLRSISNLHKINLYQKYNFNSKETLYKTYKDLVVRNFIKALLSNPPKFNLDKYIHLFDSYTKIIDFFKDLDQSIKISKSGISKLKNRKIIFKTVPKNKDTLYLVKLIKIKLPEFDDVNFFE